MATRKKSGSDPQFMQNLEAAIREEARNARRAASRPALPAPDAPAPPVKTGAPQPGTSRPAASSAESDRESLLKELRSLLPKLDAEGLDFLLEQAKIHLYNMEVERLNASSPRAKGASGSGRAGVTAKTGLRLDRSASGSSYYLWANGDSTMFTAEEMLALVRIAQGQRGEPEAARAVGAWLERERRDAIEGLRLPGAPGPALLEFARLLRKSFRKPGSE